MWLIQYYFFYIVLERKNNKFANVPIDSNEEREKIKRGWYSYMTMDGPGEAIWRTGKAEWCVDSERRRTLTKQGERKEGGWLTFQGLDRELSGGVW